MTRKLGALGAFLALTIIALFGASPASATSKVGPWWTGVGNCSSIGVSVIQGHYQNYVSKYGDYFTRADGYNVKLSVTYIRKISITQNYVDGMEAGYREWYFTGNAETSSMTGVSTSLLPWIPADRSVGAKMTVRVWTSSYLNLVCAFTTTIGQG